jgi:hypothetical protein
MCLHVQAQIEDFHPLALDTGLDIFPSDVQRQFTERANILSRRSAELGLRGVEDGTIQAAGPAALKNLDHHLDSMRSLGIIR